MRQFNTSEPNILALHYTLPRLDLIAKGKKMVGDSCYFMVWAFQPTGKSAYFRLLTTALENEGYLVCQVNFVNYYNCSLAVFMERFVAAVKEAWDLDLNNLDIAQAFQRIEAVKDKKLVLIIDEVEGINPEYFGEFLHTIRNAYHYREKNALKSVIFVGVSNITGVVQDNGKAQLAYYIKSLGLTKGIYLIFVNSDVTNPYVLEGADIIEGVDLTTYLVRYDTEVDFSEPRKTSSRKRKN
jgi:hypothetical protein